VAIHDIISPISLESRGWFALGTSLGGRATPLLRRECTILRNPGCQVNLLHEFRLVLESPEFRNFNLKQAIVSRGSV
jgi:hypothetical protein